MPLSRRAKEIILKQPRKLNGPIFDILSDSVGHAFNKVTERAGIDDFRFHDLRHSTASYLAMSGATLLEIADILGHKTLQMVKRYSHLSEDHKATVLEKMNKKVFG